MTVLTVIELPEAEGIELSLCLTLMTTRRVNSVGLISGSCGRSASYRPTPRAPNNQNAEVSHNAIRMANSTPPAMGSAQPG
jgi:hypothetical protein